MRRAIRAALLAALGWSVGCADDDALVRRDAGRDAAVELDAGLDAALDAALFDAGELDARLDAAVDAEVPPDAPIHEPTPMTLLQANVGNVDFGCRDYAYKLCYSEVEARIAASIAMHAPDVVALQEVAPIWQCTMRDERSEDYVCHPSHRDPVQHQVRRLVGEDFTIACNARNQFECVAVRRSWGSIDGCGDGALCLTGARTMPMDDGCDDGFTISTVVIRPRTGAAPFTLVNAHPPSGFSVDCRASQLRRLFEGVAAEPAFAPPARVLLSGDFNLDPFGDDDASTRVWTSYVGEGRRFAYHSGPAERDPPYASSFAFAMAKVLDHVASDFAAGTCQTLGEAPGTFRLDQGSGCDHRALRCTLTLP